MSWPPAPLMPHATTLPVSHSSPEATDLYASVTLLHLDITSSDIYMAYSLTSFNSLLMIHLVRENVPDYLPK